MKRKLLPKQSSLFLTLILLSAGLTSQAKLVSQTESIHNQEQAALVDLTEEPSYLPITIPNYLNITQRGVKSVYPYYGEIFYQYKDSNFEDLSSIRIKNLLFSILTADHLPQKNDFDILLKNCDHKACYRHRNYSYIASRRFLMGTLHLNTKGRYSIKSFYCLKKFEEQDFPRDSSIGPGKIPHHTILNTEHAWPQSHFTTRFQINLQRSDLHHIFPVSSPVNSARSNLRYAAIYQVTKKVCQYAKIGFTPLSRKRYFEPPNVHKGDLARAIFYFSIRYKIPIEAEEEYHLRNWHSQDPVSYQEILRNNSIYPFQQNRNPFIDHPELTNFINNF